MPALILLSALTLLLAACATAPAPRGELAGTGTLTGVVRGVVRGGEIRAYVAPPVHPVVHPEPAFIGPHAPEPQPVQVPTPAATPAPAVSASLPVFGLGDAAWVGTRPGAHYTVQVLAGTDLQGLKRFARRSALPGPLAWFPFHRRGHRWYALVAGEYADFAAARRARAELAARLPGREPWIRRFADIQALTH